MSESRPVILMLELTRGEVGTLDRALRMYAAKYQDMAGREKHPADKQDLLNYVARADELLDRLRQDRQSAAPTVSAHYTEMTMEPKYPQVQVQLVGGDGNAFAILGAVRKAMRRAGLAPEQIEEFQKEATAGDYDHLLRTAMKYVEVS